MLRLFKEWLSNNEIKFKGLGIKIDDITQSIEDSPDPSIRVDHISYNSMGRITVWGSKKIDIEVIDFNTGDTKLFEHKQINNEVPNFDLLLETYIKTMQE